MANIISIHSFRGGTGKSNTTANLAALLAMQGQVKGWILRKKILIEDGNLLKSPLIVLLILASVYGGYFGAGVSVIVLATLVNALKMKRLEIEK